MTNNNEALQQERNKRRDEYVRINTMKWLENGDKLSTRRKKHNMSLREVASHLGTSATRIRSLEVGDPVSMAEHLTTCYNLLFDYIELRNELYENIEVNKELLQNHLLIK